MLGAIYLVVSCSYDRRTKISLSLSQRVTADLVVTTISFASLNTVWQILVVEQSCLLINKNLIKTDGPKVIQFKASFA